MMIKLQEYPPFHFLVFLIFGIVLQYYYQIWKGSPIYLFLTLGFFLCLVLFFKKRKGVELILFLFFIFLGIARVYLKDKRNHKSYYENLSLHNNYKTLLIRKVLKSSSKFYRYEASVVAVDSIKSEGDILVYIRKDSFANAIQVGQYLFTKENFKDVASPLKFVPLGAPGAK